MGTKQLEENSLNSFYTRTEGQYWLMRIYYYEDEPIKAYELSKYLHETFPDNAYFHRYFARVCFSQSKLDMTLRLSYEILEKIRNNFPGYEAVSGRYASFFLGYIYYNRDKDLAKAKNYFQLCMDFSEKVNEEEAGYYLYSISNLAEIADKESDEKLAIGLYKKLLDLTDKKDALHKKATAYLKDKGELDSTWWPF